MLNLQSCGCSAVTTGRAATPTVRGAWSGLACALLFSGCIESEIDLRSPTATPALCAFNERVNPQTGRCSRCDTVQETAEERCLCGSEPLPSEFPWCEGEAPFRCLPCRRLDDCTGYRAATEEVLDCAQVQRCCGELEENTGAEPCCGSGEIAVCFAHPTIADSLALECVAPTTCCDTVECDDASPCEEWQVCDDGVCRPGCDPGQFFCCEGCGCTCEMLEGPG
ncbi:MAG: hypothetical protein AAF605_02585 [Myxococcota bacterium]